MPHDGSGHGERTPFAACPDAKRGNLKPVSGLVERRGDNAALPLAPTTAHKPRRRPEAYSSGTGCLHTVDNASDRRQRLKFGAMA